MENSSQAIDDETFVGWFREKVWNMDFSFLLIISLFAVFAWRHMIYRFETQKFTIPTWAQYYSVMYGCFAVLMLLNFWYGGMLLHTTGFLDGETIRASELAKLEVNESEIHDIVDDWRRQADLDDYPVLKYFSMSMPLWVTLTFCCCVMHTMKYVRKMPKRLIYDYKRDRTIVILALPFVYGFMSLWSVMHVWQITANSISLTYTVFDSVNGTIDMRMKAYEANFAVADAYEAVALWSFATLTLEVLAEGAHKLEVKLNNDIRLLKKYNIGDNEKEKRVKKGLEDDLEEFETDAETLGQSIGRLTMGGVKWFCVSCVITAICEIVPVQVYDWYGENAEKEFMSTYMTPTNASYLSGFLTGLGTIGSFAAIENLFIVEIEFGETHLRHFNTTKKFWSTKVLVSLVFLQQILFTIPPMSSWSLVRQKLTNANMLCFECFLISIGHFMSWKADEAWYTDIKQEDNTEIQQPLLDDTSSISSTSTP